MRDNNPRSGLFPAVLVAVAAVRLLNSIVSNFLCFFFSVSFGQLCEAENPGELKR